MARLKKGEKKVRVTDIAEKSGVSPATVSMALNNRPGIPAETRQRILALALEMGYQAKGGKTRQKNQELSQIGVLMRADFSSNVFYSDVLIGIDQACKQHHLHLLYGSIAVTEENIPLEIPAMIAEGVVDAVLIVGIHVNQELSDALERSGIPTVLVDGYSSARCYDAVLSDNFEAAYQAVTYLLSKGHRHIGLVGSSPDSYPSIKERRLGYMRAILEHRLPAMYIADSGLDPLLVQKATVKLLSEHPEITALFGVNDESLVAALEVASKMGRSIPSDISAVGFDDIIYATRFDPPVTTMRVNRAAMGQMSVEALFDRIQVPDAPNFNIQLKTTFIERQSVRDRNN